jgi:iron complex outermembrane receptor protein
LNPIVDRVLLVSVALLLALGGRVGWAATADDREYYDIASGPANNSLIEFARQSGEPALSVLIPADSVGQIRTNAVRGRFPRVEALGILLRDTGLSGSIDAAGVLTVVMDTGGNMVQNRSRLGWLGGMLAILAGPAPAQEVGTSGSEELEEVTVTGSRVISNGNDSPTPVTVVSTEQLLQMNPGPLTQALSMLPALLATPNQGGQGPNPQAVINLRGIGGTRNLILFDGHRVAPTTAGGGVDTNLIPTMLLKRVDIVTGGASAVYGSDAVSGVVNYVVDNNFNGFKFTGQAGVSTYGDDRTWNAGFAFGTPLFGGRGHFEISYQIFEDPGVRDRFDRGWGRGLWSAQGSVPGLAATTVGSAVNPYQLYSNTRLNSTSFGGLINSGPLAGLNFTQNGVLSPFVRGAPTGTPTAEIGGDGGYYTVASAFAGQDMRQGFGRFDFNFTDTVKAYAQIAAAQTLNTTYGAGGGVWNAEVRTRAIGWNNAYLSTVQQPYQATIAAQRAANPNGSFNFSRIITADQFPPPSTELLSKSLMVLAGLEGSWGKYHWNIGVERADSRTTNTNPTNLSNARLFAALNAVVNPANGQIVCNAALANPAVYGSCVPLNLFGPTASSNRAAFDYIRQPTQATTEYTMNDVTFAVTGAPLDNWAGPVDMAVSGEWRKLSYEVNSTALPTDPVNCTGIQFNCVGATPYFAGISANFPKASTTVSELAYEIQFPLLRDASLAKSLSLNGAARYTDYETSGSVSTWKLGATWAMNDALTMRVTRSRDIRAPTLSDLYAPTTVGTVSIFDLHTGVTANTSSITQGNPNLTPEKADNWTAGFVWTPQFVDGVSLSMDYYRINIKNGIVGIGTRQPSTMAACEVSNGTSPICAFYIRPFPFSNTSAANFPTSIINASLNSAGYLAYGVDTELSYSRPIRGRNFSARLLMNYQPHLIYDLGPAGILDVGGAADGVGGLPATPNLKGVLMLNYQVMENLTASVQERYRNAVKQNGSPLLFFAYGKQPPTFYTDLSVNYKLTALGAGLETFLNIRNVFNKQPDPWASTGGNSQIGSFGGWLQGDDPLGRYYIAGLRYKL